jgi:hypothetical protein
MDLEEQVSNPEKSKPQQPPRGDKTAAVFVWLFLTVTGCQDLLEKLNRIVPQIKQLVKQLFSGWS